MAQEAPEQEKQNVEREFPGFVDKESAQALSNFIKFKEENIKGAQLFFGDNRKDEAVSYSSAEDNLTFLLDVDGVREKIVGLKQIYLFANSTGYDSVNKILNIAPGATSAEIKEVLTVDERLKDKKPQTTDGVLMAELNKGSVQQVEDPGQVVNIDDESLTPVESIIQAESNDYRIPIESAPDVSVGDNKRQEIRKNVDEAYSVLTEDDKKTLESADIKVVVEYDSKKISPVFKDDGAVHIDLDSPTAEILKAFKFAIRKLTQKASDNSEVVSVVPTQTIEEELDTNALNHKFIGDFSSEEKTRLEGVLDEALDALTEEEMAVLSSAGVAIEVVNQTLNTHFVADKKMIEIGSNTDTQSIILALKDAVAKTKLVAPAPEPDQSVEINKKKNKIFNIIDRYYATLNEEDKKILMSVDPSIDFVGEDKHIPKFYDGDIPKVYVGLDSKEEDIINILNSAISVLKKKNIINDPFGGAPEVSEPEAPVIQAKDQILNVEPQPEPAPETGPEVDPLTKERLSTKTLEENLKTLLNDKFNGAKLYVYWDMDSAKTYSVEQYKKAQDVLNAIAGVLNNVIYTNKKGLSGLKEITVSGEQKTGFDNTTGIFTVNVNDSGENISNQLLKNTTELEVKPIWRESEEWNKLVDIRERAARDEVRLASVSSLQQGQSYSEYVNYKNVIADKIKESVKADMFPELGEGPLTPEQYTAFVDKVNDIIYKELVEAEHVAYMDAMKTKRGESVLDKTLNVAKTVLGNKMVQWYLSQNKYVRLGMNTALITGATATGVLAGGAVAGGTLAYGGYRLARGVASLAGSGFVAKIANNSMNKLKDEEKEEQSKVKKSGADLEEMTSAYRSNAEVFDKKKRNKALVNMATIVGAGAGAGVLAGLAENFVAGSVGSVAESALNAKPKLDQSLGGPKPAGVPEDILNSKPKLSNEAVKNIIDMGNSKAGFSPEALKVVPKDGEGLWNVLKQPLNENPEFMKLNPAQQQNVLMYYTNKGISDPDKFGFIKDDKFGVHVEGGKVMDLSKLMDDPEELQRVLARAGKLSEKVQADILENSRKIAEYKQAHSGEAMTVEKVNEVVSGKPVAEVAPTPREEMTMVNPNEAESVFTAKPKVAEVNQDIYDFRRPLDVVDKSTTVLTKPTMGVDKSASDIYTDIPTENPIAKARSMFADSVDVKQIKMGVEQGVNDVYTDKGIFFKTQGIDTKDWGLMKALNAKQVVQYMKHDSLDAGLAPKIVEDLQSTKHMNFIKELDGLMKQTKITEALPNENVEGFLSRLIKTVLKTQADKSTIK